MDHDTAAKTHATERYLLGEMPPDERETFEAHLLSCRICDEDIHLTTMFVENAKAVFREQGIVRAPERGRSRRNWFRLQFAIPAFAALSLALVAGYQNVVVIPGLRTPRVLPPAIILDGVTRSGLPQVPSENGLRFEMAVDAPAGADRLEVAVTGETGSRLWSETVVSPGLNQPLDVYFPFKLKPGRYSIIIRDAHGVTNGPALATNRFEVVK